jgi:hypothetical protein
MEDIMRKFAACLLIGALSSAPAIAHDEVTAFSSRGACESASAAMSQEDTPWLLETFPDLFDTQGEAESFLTKAWTCDRNASDSQYYITNHIEEVLGSRWYDRRNH